MSRGVQDRIRWFDANDPGAIGQCLRHTWQATLLPVVGMPDANAGAAYVKGAGHMHGQDRKPPRGAWVWYASPTHGHVALALGNGQIISTDAPKPRATGVVLLSYPETHWGHTYLGWSSWYGQEFTVGREEEDMPLSDDDLDKIAQRVWAYDVETGKNDPQGDKPARWFLTRILDKVKDLKP